MIVVGNLNSSRGEFSQFDDFETLRFMVQTNNKFNNSIISDHLSPFLFICKPLDDVVLVRSNWFFITLYGAISVSFGYLWAPYPYYFLGVYTQAEFRRIEKFSFSSLNCHFCRKIAKMITRVNSQISTSSPYI